MFRVNNDFLFEKVKDLITLIKDAKRDIRDISKETDVTKADIRDINTKLKDIEKKFEEVKTIKETKTETKTNDFSSLYSNMELLKKMLGYHIKDGYWYFNNEKIYKAVGESIKGDNGKDGSNGKDGRDGKDGKNGLDGRNGKDGRDGANGKDGKDGTNGIDGITPNIEIGKVDTVTSSEGADVTITKNDNNYKLNFKIPRGPRGGSGGGTSGSADVDLTNYYNKTQVNTLLPYYQTKTTLDATLVLGTQYKLGVLTGNMSFALPNPATAGLQEIAIIGQLDGTLRTLTITGTNYYPFTSTLLTNKAFIFRCVSDGTKWMISRRILEIA